MSIGFYDRHDLSMSEHTVCETRAASKSNKMRLLEYRKVNKLYGIHAVIAYSLVKAFLVCDVYLEL